MTKLLTRLFIKNSEDVGCPSVRSAYGTLSGIVGIIVNFALSAMKLVLGLISGSLAIMADALNNLSDSGASLITLVSFKMAAKPADREHPFGHARIEYIASMIVSFLILLVGFEMITDSVTTLINGADSNKPNILTFIILAVAIVLKLWLSLFYRSVGKKINSSTLIASSQDSFFDAMSTSAVLVSSIIIKFTGWMILDAIFGIAVSILIIVAGIRILNETKNNLLGEAPVSETVDSIKKIVAEYPEVLGMHDLLVHNYGPGRFVASFHAEVDGNGDIYVLHDTIDNIEKRISEELNILCTIHLDPLLIGDPVIDEYKNMVLACIREVSADISVHDFRIVTGNSHTNLIFDIVIPFETTAPIESVKQQICELVSKKNNTCYCVITVDRA